MTEAGLGGCYEQWLMVKRWEDNSRKEHRFLSFRKSGGKSCVNSKGREPLSQRKPCGCTRRPDAWPRCMCFLWENN